ncbi:MAG: bifunctional diguanylate cyclase/phosphodiesterase [Actinomycetota bacterium]|nr:bifunctional diguanylate cyclase/phosphodiesterase [Actinomycetota bacterium]
MLARPHQGQGRRLPPPSLLRTLPTYSAVVTLAAAIVFIGVAGTGERVPLDDWQYLLFVALIVAGELLPVDVPRGGGRDRVTVSSAFAFAVLLLFGTLPAMVACALASLAADVPARLSPAKVAFNAAQYALAVAAAGAALKWTGQDLPVESLGTALVASLAGAGVFFVVNHLLVSPAAALLTGTSLWRQVSSGLPFKVATAGVVLTLAPVIVACALTSVWLVPLCLLPVLAVYVGARQTVRDLHRAMYDGLTELPNRVLLREHIERALEDASDSGHRAALMVLDLNDFKAVNDTMGYAYGDRLLQAVSARLASALDPGDVLARLGADEFAVLSAPVHDGRYARALAERLGDAMCESFELEEIVLDVRASIGVALYPDDATTADMLLRKADVALHSAKDSQQPVELYAVAQDHYTVDRLLLAAQLRRGLENGEIVVEYQPKYPLRGGRPTGVEALARWQHPELGRIGPDGFIPLAEQSGLINRLTDVVMGEALGQVAEWRRQGVDLRVGVNLSPRTLLDANLPQRIAATLAAAGIEAGCLQLEITESRSVPSGPVADAVIERLRVLGVGLAIDDFGTGFSSLVQLQRLPVDEIKIDRSFVANMDRNTSDATIVRSTIELAHNLGLTVTAEGVETESARRQLAEMGCELAQGYGLCRPVSAEGCAEAVRRFAPAQATPGQ